MRSVGFMLSVMCAAGLFAQSQDARPAGSAPQTLTTNAPVSGKPPSVYWKRGMTGKPSPLPEPSATAPRTVSGKTANTGTAGTPSGNDPNDPYHDDLRSGLPPRSRPPSATPVETESAEPEPPAASPVKSEPPPVAAVPLPAAPRKPRAPKISRDQMIQALGELKPGDTRELLVKKLGEPVYSIGMPESGQFVEKCRFRAGVEPVASVELHDGVIVSIDKAIR